MSIRTLLLAAVAATSFTVPVAAHAAPGGGAVTYLVPCTGETIYTVPTVSNSTYTFVVSGVCAYGDGLGLSDCGHFSRPDGSDLLGQWHGGRQFWVDGLGAPCASQSTAASHTYVFTLAGTGMFAMYVRDGGYAGDNTGWFSVTVTPSV